MRGLHNSISQLIAQILDHHSFKNINQRGRFSNYKHALVISCHENNISRTLAKELSMSNFNRGSASSQNSVSIVEHSRQTGGLFAACPLLNTRSLLVYIPSAHVCHADIQWCKN